MNKRILTQLKSAAIIALFLTSIVLITMPTANAATYTNIQNPYGIPLPAGVTPDVTVKSSLGLAISPNPIGVNQQLLINMWMNPPITNARFLTGYTVTLTKPDGTKDTLGPFNSYQGDATAYTYYIPDQAGNWSAVFNFPGNYYPAGNYSSGQLVGYSSFGQVFNAPLSCYYAPGVSQTMTFVVQQDQVRSYPGTPLPTDYWTRPVTTLNRDWWPILGNYPNPYGNNYEYAGPYTVGPTSAHILWTIQGSIAGALGGDDQKVANGQGDLTTGSGTPGLIYDGRCYQTVTVPGIGSCAECYDLQTGHVYYQIPVAQGGITPTAISYGVAGLPDVVGDIADLQPGVRLLSIGARLIWIDPFTGAVIYNVTGMTGTYYNDPYVLSIQTNNTAIGNRLINWTCEDQVKNGGMTVVGTNDNFTARIISNVTFPFTSLGTCDFKAGVSVTAQAVPNAAANATVVQMGTRLIGVSLITGQVLWNVTTDHVNYSGSTAVADHGKYCFADRDDTSGILVAWDLTTGQQAWVSDKMAYPWGFGGAYAVASAYGNVYRFSYAGVYAFDWNTGKIVWRYESPCAPFESPWYPDMAFDGGGVIANGILYVGNSEHSPTQPIARGWKLSAINCTNGKGVWNITGAFTEGAVSDGYLTASNSYDGFMYVFGKGQSATTVSAPQTSVTIGTNAIISGTVLDQSPAQPGKACVSDDTVNTYMEYLHMQQPIDGPWHNVTVTGVPVSIDALDPNGNAIHIATVTSDVSGTFGYTWAPTIAGDYKITATFAGTNSYGSSWAQTYANVINALGTSPTATLSPVTFDAVNNTVVTTVLAGVIAIIIAVAIVGILLLRKHA